MNNEDFLKKIVEPQTSCGSCNKAHCCKHIDNIDISEEEWEELIPYIDKSVIAKMRIAVLSKKKYDKYDCAFLDENNKCVAYKNRPLICKLHYVNSPKKYCNTRKYKDRVIQILNKVELYIKLPQHDSVPVTATTMYDKYKQYIGDK